MTPILMAITLTLSVPTASSSPVMGGKLLKGSKAAKLIKILKKSGVETDEGMGRSRLSVVVVCYKVSGEGTFCEAGPKGVRRGKALYRMLKKLGAREEPLDGRRQGTEVGGTVECEQSLSKRKDALCCLGAGCISD